jgi:thiol-disulfide isomerase/thioredoxin
MTTNKTAGDPGPRRRIRTIGGVVGLGLGILAAFGISGRNGFGERDDDEDNKSPARPPRLARWPDRGATSDRLPVEGHMPALDATGWINSSPLTPKGLRGKVVLVDFWTYSCINWRRTLPYVRAWAQRYADHGLIVVGVHSPEFAFERDGDRVGAATREMGIGYPVAIDSDHAIWNAFENQYWPALYFIDAQGRIRHHQFGEGDYETSEMVLRQLLSEAGDRSLDGAPVSVDARGVEAAADWSNLGSPETYLGYERTQDFASIGGLVHNRRHLYAVPAQLSRNHWALAGAWTIGPHSAVVDEPGGQVALQFHARDLHLVMGPGPAGARVRFRVRIDGQPPGPARGVDVDEQGNGVIAEPRLYQLIRQEAPIGDRRFEIELLDPGAQVFVFAFG